ncbi:hypothetical protein [Streptomyces sp. NPDC051183]|uniref:hypothetical protein n=1 Tax=Streptomyces sp. NPDC051183 TaxID=3155165 RepID=UPI00343EC7CF
MAHNTLLKAIVNAKIRTSGWVRGLQSRDRDRGQTAFEYLGIILVVVVIIGAIVGTGIGTAITDRIGAAVQAVTAGGGKK